MLARPNKSRNVVQSRNLLSKFLYHSISSQANDHSDTEPCSNDTQINVKDPPVPILINSDSSIHKPVSVNVCSFIGL